MARNRMIKREFWEDDKLAECSFVARLFYISLWTFADDEGFLEYRPKWLKAKSFPYDNVDVEKLTNDLLTIDRVEIRSGILKVKNFLKHQKIDHPTPSTLSHIFNNSPNPRESSRIDPPNIKESKLKESNIIYVDEASTLEEIFEGFKKHNALARLIINASKKNKVLARLKSFSKVEILEAIENRANDSFMSGDNPGGKVYRKDFMSLFRSDEQVEKWLNRKKINPMDLL